MTATERPESVALRHPGATQSPDGSPSATQGLRGAERAVTDAEPERVWIACGRGICAAEEGHEGTCDEASGWAEEATPQEAHDRASFERILDRRLAEALPASDSDVRSVSPARDAGLVAYEAAAAAAYEAGPLGGMSREERAARHAALARGAESVPSAAQIGAESITVDVRRWASHMADRLDQAEAENARLREDLSRLASEWERELTSARRPAARDAVADAEAAEWAALADAATEGPWAIMGGGEYVSGIGTLVGVECAGGVRDVDAAFVAAARTAVPRLLVEREALRADHAALLALYEVEVARRESFEARVTRLTADLDAMEAEDSREDVRAKHWTEVLRVRRELAGVRGENNDAMEVIARGLGYSSSDFPLDRWPHLAMTGDHTSVSLAEEVVGRLGQACDFAARVEAENARLVDRIEQLSAEYEADLPESMAGDERLRRVFDDHANDVLGLLSDEDEGGE